MPNRKLLKDALTCAWKKTITQNYAAQVINSERGLQMFFCMALIHYLKAKPRRIFIEPLVFRGKNEGAICPDLIICNTKEIIGVVEFKYLPRSRPQYKKDIDTLAWIAKSQGVLKISNDRYLGKKVGPITYGLANDPVLCWAAVYKGPRMEIRHDWVDSSNSSFFRLDALTRQSLNPELLAGAN